MGPTREEVVAHLLATGMAGQVATPRENNLDHYQRLAYRDPDYMFGLNPGRGWDQDAILELMAQKVGVDPRASFRHGVDTIDPELTVAALDRYAARFDKALREKQRVLFATGHPRTLARLYQRLAAALTEAGGTVVEVGAGSGYDGYTRHGWQRLEVDSFLGVATLGDAGGSVHTHSDRPIRLVLAALEQAGAALPDLVVADHGWCGGAAFAGIDAIGFADCNDPALFVGEEEGTVAVSVPLDDGVDAPEYDLLGAYILAASENRMDFGL
ncbi:phosphatase [Nocardia sp. SYP-A9097]|uniref:phosphatase n=1 Tax=Nocardia sp. SYP-A9097 TaxID=2663237 RepID=UPI00129A60E0|nr:phosphatase [Nocardia sp. SYP-A9097]MRH89749.1 phosphatase [Nocardia sp. SYP-A9097]